MGGAPASEKIAEDQTKLVIIASSRPLRPHSEMTAMATMSIKERCAQEEFHSLMTSGRAPNKKSLSDLSLNKRNLNFCRNNGGHWQLRTHAYLDIWSFIPDFF